MSTAEWQRRVDALWASFDDDRGDEERFRAAVDALAAELPAGDPDAAFERAGAWDSTGHPDRAVPLYESALAHGLNGANRRRAVIQLASSLRNLGRPEESVRLLEAERTRPGADAADAELDDAVSAFLALALADVGEEREAAALALRALAPHLSRYQRSVRAYAEALVEPGEGAVH